MKSVGEDLMQFIIRWDAFFSYAPTTTWKYLRIDDIFLVEFFRRHRLRIFRQSMIICIG